MTKPKTAKPADVDARSLLDRMAAARQAEAEALASMPDAALAEAFETILAQPELQRAAADLAALASAMSDPQQAQRYGAVASLFRSAWGGLARVKASAARAAEAPAGAA